MVGVPREPGLRVPAEASVALAPDRTYVPISQIGPIDPDQEFAEDEAGYGATSGHVRDVTDMVTV